MKGKLRKWEHLVNFKCLNCNKRFITKVYICQSGMLKGEWMIGSTYCSTNCLNKFEKKIRGVKE